MSTADQSKQDFFFFLEAPVLPHDHIELLNNLLFAWFDALYAAKAMGRVFVEPFTLSEVSVDVSLLFPVKLMRCDPTAPRRRLARS